MSCGQEYFDDQDQWGREIGHRFAAIPFKWPQTWHGQVTEDLMYKAICEYVGIPFTRDEDLIWKEWKAKNGNKRSIKSKASREEVRTTGATRESGQGLL